MRALHAHTQTHKNIFKFMQFNRSDLSAISVHAPAKKPEPLNEPVLCCLVIVMYSIYTYMCNNTPAHINTH